MAHDAIRYKYFQRNAKQIIEQEADYALSLTYYINL